MLWGFGGEFTPNFSSSSWHQKYEIIWKFLIVHHEALERKPSFQPSHISYNWASEEKTGLDVENFSGKNQISSYYIFHGVPWKVVLFVLQDVPILFCSSCWRENLSIFYSILKDRPCQKKRRDVSNFGTPQKKRSKNFCMSLCLPCCLEDVGNWREGPIYWCLLGIRFVSLRTLKQESTLTKPTVWIPKTDRWIRRVWFGAVLAFFWLLIYVSLCVCRPCWGRGFE